MEASLKSVFHSDACMCEVIYPQLPHNMKGRGGKRSVIVTKGRGEDSSSIPSVLGSLFVKSICSFGLNLLHFTDSNGANVHTHKKKKKDKTHFTKRGLGDEILWPMWQFPP